MGFRSSEILRQRSGGGPIVPRAREAFAKSALSLRSYHTRHFIVSVAEQLSSLPFSSLDFFLLARIAIATPALCYRSVARISPHLEVFIFTKLNTRKRVDDGRTLYFTLHRALCSQPFFIFFATLSSQLYFKSRFFLPLSLFFISLDILFLIL